METEDRIRIKPADERDLHEVSEIENASFNSPWTLDFFKHELYNPVSFFYILKIQDKLAGYVIFWIFEDEAHIANIAIHPDNRKMGYGEQLLNWIFDFCRKKGAMTISLEVSEINEAARQLYSKTGFKSVGRRAKYYEDRSDALILTKILE
ncbi:ribosomal protein S18-alanine N-acetyltransferase [bacterium]|nr:ribosomal protein S18-alanine N-acetyltransferase [bacterium]MBU1063744.1 ribosomal protein S18-alanine N-acetyltransferase [bacterium]MBU1633001.1 ribosomal protein S18-alanine N-acetyltransferase [bacterium]MBU1873040.1 ribosomal protein S18-alanine N-acetyltransferase [bacterium]